MKREVEARKADSAMNLQIGGHYGSCFGTGKVYANAKAEQGGSDTVEHLYELGMHTHVYPYQLHSSVCTHQLAVSLALVSSCKYVCVFICV